MDLWDSMHITGREGKHCIVLSCVSVFIAHSLINYSAGALWLWPAVLRRRPDSSQTKTALWQHFFLFLCRIFPLKEHAPTSVADNLGCWATVSMASDATEMIFHPFKWVNVARLRREHFRRLSFLLLLQTGEVKKKKKDGGDFRELGGVPQLSVAISHRLFNQRHYFTAPAASQPRWLGVSN